MKKKLSETHKKKLSEGKIGKSYEEFYGKERAVEEREKRRLAHLGNKYPVEKYPNKGTRNKKWGHHSQESKIKISAFQQGISVEDWKKFKLNLSRFLRNTARSKTWKFLVFTRDNFTCQNPNCKFCGNIRGVYIQAHHELSLALYPEFAFDLKNGITYCRDYHLKSGLHKNMKELNINGGIKCTDF